MTVFRNNKVVVFSNLRTVYIEQVGGVYSATAIVVGSGHSDTSSNPG